MLNTSSVVAFAATSQPDTARAFYGESLGLTLLEETPFALVFDAAGTTLRIQKVEQATPPPYTVLGWEVTGIDSTMEALTGRGIAFEKFQGLPQNEQGVWITPDGTKVAWFRDPDGHLLSLTENG